jgi:uncharacterized protein DUF748
MAYQAPAIEREREAKERERREEKQAKRTEAEARAAERPRAEPPPPRPPAHRRWRPSRRGWITLGVVLAILALVAALGSHLFDEPLRRTLEGKMNQHLKGYRVTLGHAHLNPLDLALTLRDLVIRQEANPDPPVAAVARLRASVEWPALLTFHLVADAAFDQPRVHIDLRQLKQEARDQVRLKDRGWQQAFESIYPLKFDHIAIRDGELAYIDTDPQKPLLVDHLSLEAQNIRNIHSRDRVYPSPVHAEGVVFGEGRAVVDGHADFLAEPYPGVHAVYSAERIPLERLRPITSRANLSLKGGVLASKGECELGPRHREVRVDDVTIRGLRLDYLHSAATTAAEQTRAAKAEAAVSREPTIPIRVVRLRLLGGELGLVNRAKDPPFRIFLDGLDLNVTDFSTGPGSTPAHALLTGRFMGTGSARGTATFRPGAKNPDFDLSLAVEGAELPKLNDVLRAYGKFDVTAGTFSVYSEIAVAGGQIHGYVKPLFKDIQVYDPQQDKDKPPLKKLYEKVVSAASHLLKNRPRQEVATRADISGPVGGAHTSTWDVFVGLLENAFVKAILPGFDREIDALRHKK